MRKNLKNTLIAAGVALCPMIAGNVYGSESKGSDLRAKYLRTTAQIYLDLMKTHQPQNCTTHLSEANQNTPKHLPEAE